MTAPARAPRRGRALAALVVAALLVAAFLWRDRGSLERGNRLYRRGDVPAAARLYGAAEASDSSAKASYNLGTSLLTLDPDSAGRHLFLAAARADSAAAPRAYYNLGYHFLERAGPGVEAGPARVLLAAAVASNRAALRLDPGFEDARWNLALSQRMLDSLTARLPRPGALPIDSIPRERGPDEDPSDVALAQRVVDSLAEGAPEPADATPAGEADRGVGDALLPSESEGGPPGREPRAAPPSDDRGSDGRDGGRGEREALAAGDPGPLSEAAAERLLAEIVDDPEQLIRGLLWAHRPDVAWWDGEPFPGGAR